jgi:LmbE family N-acetylglucosaminyl deacetylase
VVVAHPDDETAVGAYLARAIFDEHKRVAVVFGTRGGSGGNAQGREQAAALQDIREIEAHRALAHFGVSNVWFLEGLDTPGQDVLRSLNNWNHGDQLGRLIRIVRLTRPEVVMTWLPDVLAGENHGDHQAAGVLATEAFDLAGDPVAFPEQVAAPRDPQGQNNLLDGLHSWQAKKLYFFSDTSHPETLDGKGPRYAADQLSPSRHVSYARLAAEEGAEHLTQGDSGGFAHDALISGKLGYFADPVRLLVGKSLVPSGIRDDVFAGVTEESIPFRPAPVSVAPAAKEVRMKLGGPWLFYEGFWREHGLDGLDDLVQPELLLNFESPLTLPIFVSNPTNRAVELTPKISLPAGWIYWRRPPERIKVPAHGELTFTFEARTPEAGKGHDGNVIIEVNGLKPLRLRAILDRSAMPQ